MEPATPTADSTTITIVPVVKDGCRYKATSRYVDMFWTPVLGSDGVALLRWASHQIGPVDTSEVELGTAIGARATSQVRRIIDRLIRHGLATASGTALHVTVSLPPLSRNQANRFGTTFANRHRREAARATASHRQESQW